MLSLKNIPFVGNSSKRHQLLLIESGIVRHVYLEERDNGYGPYIVGVIVDERTGETGKFLIELKDYSVQEALLLVDHKVKVLVRSNGSKLKPLELQFPEVVELISVYRAKTEFKLDSNESIPVKNSIDTDKSFKNKNITSDATVTTTATGSPGTTATGSPGTTATGEETVAQKELLNLEDSDQEETLNILENLMATATQKCHDFGLPMFIGICLPPKKYKK